MAEPPTVKSNATVSHSAYQADHSASEISQGSFIRMNLKSRDLKSRIMSKVEEEEVDETALEESHQPIEESLGPENQGER